MLTYHDRFNFWRWSSKALGMPGLVLVWSAMFRKQARANLDRFLAKNPATEAV